MSRTLKSTLIVIAALLALAVLAAAAAFVGVDRYRNAPIALSTSPVRVTIPRGAHPRAIAAELRRRGIEVPGWWMALAARARGDAAQIKSGMYELSSPITLRGLLDKLVRGDIVMADIRFVEGTTFAQMREAIARHPDLQHDTAGLSERQLLDRLGAPERNAEGLFLPNTYLFSPGSSDLDVYRSAYRALHKALDEAWAQRSEGLPYQSPYEALIVASIVEKETGRDSDRDKVAAVFVNRLKRGMLLQSDPTTIYGIGERFDGNLRKRDLQADTEYNTYRRAGLPPTPIALVGKASLRAATRPAPIDALYFVARGDGSSEFSDDLATHNRAVNRYQLRRP